MKDHAVDPRDTGEQNPYRALLFKLTKKNYKPPRQKTPVNHWRISHHDRINTIAHEFIHQPKDAAAIRDRVTRAEFNKLSEVEQEDWSSTQRTVMLQRWPSISRILKAQCRHCQRIVSGMWSFYYFTSSTKSSSAVSKRSRVLYSQFSISLQRPLG